MIDLATNLVLPDWTVQFILTLVTGQGFHAHQSLRDKKTRELRHPRTSVEFLGKHIVATPVSCTGS
jgi:hypothetical protein